RVLFRSQREEGQVAALCGEQLLHGSAGARTGVAHVEALALEVVKALDAGVLAGDDSERLRMQGEDGTQLFEFAGVLELAFAVIGVVRSEEHTSELQSRENLVCRLLLGKKYGKVGLR